MGSCAQWLLAQIFIVWIWCCLACVGKVDFLGKPFITSVLLAIKTFHLPKCESLCNRLTWFPKPACPLRSLGVWLWMSSGPESPDCTWGRGQEEANSGVTGSMCRELWLSGLEWAWNALSNLAPLTCRVSTPRASPSRSLEEVTDAVVVASTYMVREWQLA